MSLENFQGQKLGSGGFGGFFAGFGGLGGVFYFGVSGVLAAQFLTLKILQGHAAFVENLKKTPKELFF